MPLLPGKSKSVLESNFHDFRHGKTFAHTAKKFGKARADKQLVAVVLSNARRHPKGNHPKGTKDLYSASRSSEGKRG